MNFFTMRGRFNQFGIYKYEMSSLIYSAVFARL